MSGLFSILELNEVAFMFLTLAVIITFSQFCFTLLLSQDIIHLFIWHFLSSFHVMAWC